MQDVVICAAKRTPMGSLNGALVTKSASELGSAAILAVLNDSRLPTESIDEVFMGIVLPAGVGQAPARQASLGAGISHSVPCTAISKVCGSGMQSVRHAVAQILSGQSQVVVAGGMESMSNAPYLAPKMRNGARIGHSQFFDHMFMDGLEDASSNSTLMGVFAEKCAQKYAFSRSQQDDYALASLSRARGFADILSGEITEIGIAGKPATVVASDEQPSKAQPENIPRLKPAFGTSGTVTAANASSISDGAAALVLASRTAAEKSGAPIRARILATSTHAQEPCWFTTAPIGAAQRLLDQVGWTASEVDLWEVNEAFAVVPMAFMQDLEIPHDKMNVLGGACALGHPIGASGARILVTLVNALEHFELRRGVATICIGGGEALALAIEREV